MGKRSSNGHPGSFHVCRASSAKVVAKWMEVWRIRRKTARSKEVEIKATFVVHGTAYCVGKPKK
jgi:hypothetical protein